MPPDFVDARYIHYRKIRGYLLNSTQIYCIWLNVDFIDKVEATFFFGKAVRRFSILWQLSSFYYPQV